MKYYIPRYYLTKIEKLVKWLQKKTEVKFEIFHDDTKIEIFNYEGVRYRYTTVAIELEVDYKVGDYQLVAELEHTGNGVIIRQINQELSVPKSYRTAKCYCEHCKTNRYRKNTFLLVDKDNNYKQVGSSCLNEYTGIDAESLINKVSSLHFLLNSNMDVVDEEFLEFLKGSQCNYWTIEEVLNKGYQVISRDGYNREARYAEVLLDINYLKDLEPKIKEIISVINTDWYEDDNDYCHNVKVILGMNYCENKHLRILMSYIFSAMKYLDSKANAPKDSYLGEVGSRIEFKIKEFKVLYTSYSYYTYYGESSYLYRILTDSNNIVIWKTDKILEIGNKIKATIKELSEYKGEKQTVVTRGALL